MYLFGPVESKSDVHLCRLKLETLNNPGKNKISGLLQDIYFSFIILYFDVLTKFKSDVHFRWPCIKNLDNPEKLVFSRIIENIRYGGRFPLRQAAKGLAQSLLRFTSSLTACNRRYRAAQSFALVRKK